MFPSDDAVLPEELDMQQVSHLLIIDAAWWVPSGPPLLRWLLESNYVSTWRN
jgi:hypothetical protein